MKEKSKMEKIVAYHQNNTFGGIVILDIEYGVDDKVKTAFYHDGVISGKGWNKVYYHPTGESYFKKGGVRYFLDDFIVNKEELEEEA